MDWKLSRGLSVVFAVLLVTSGVGPFVSFSPVQKAEAASGSAEYIIYQYGSDDVLRAVYFNGTEKWNRSITGVNSLEKVEGGLFIAVGSEKLKKLNTDTGNTIWSKNYTNLYAMRSTQDKHLIMANNTRIWEFNTVKNKTVYDVSNPTGGSYRMGAENGEMTIIGNGNLAKLGSSRNVIWNRSHSLNKRSVGFGASGDVLVGTAGGSLVRFDSPTGSKVETINLDPTGSNYKITGIEWDAGRNQIFVGQETVPLKTLNSSYSKISEWQGPNDQQYGEISIIPAGEIFYGDGSDGFANSKAVGLTVN